MSAPVIPRNALYLLRLICAVVTVLLGIAVLIKSAGNTVFVYAGVAFIVTGVGLAIP